MHTHESIMLAADMAPCAAIPGDHGAELHVEVWGKLDPVFFFIHGMGDGSFVWRHIIPSLSHLGAAVAIDLRGHGDSPRDTTLAYATQTHVRDVSVVLQRLCQKPVVVVGHSLGAQIALHVWATQVHRILGIVLVDGGPELNEDAVSFSRQQFASQPWSYPTINAYVSQLQERFPLTAPALLNSLAPYALRVDSEGVYHLKCDRALTKYRRPDEPSLWPAFQAVSCPLLVIRGAGSAILPRSTAIRMTRENRYCALQTVPLAGHAVSLDNPLGFVAALKSQTAILSTTARNIELDGRQGCITN